MRSILAAPALLALACSAGPGGPPESMSSPPPSPAESPAVQHATFAAG